VKNSAVGDGRNMLERYLHLFKTNLQIVLVPVNTELVKKKRLFEYMGAWDEIAKLEWEAAAASGPEQLYRV